MDHAKLLDVLTSLPVSQSILLRAVCFAMSHLANHAICSFIDLSGYASGPIRRCLFIDYIIIVFIAYLSVKVQDFNKVQEIQTMILLPPCPAKISHEIHLGHTILKDVKLQDA